MECENSLILKDNSLISQPMQQVLPFPFPPLPLPPLSPPTSPHPSIPPLLLPVIQPRLLPSPRISIPFSPIEGPKRYKLYPRMSRTIANLKIKNSGKQR
jgi:hypothetical protein